MQNGKLEFVNESFDYMGNCDDTDDETNYLKRSADDADLNNPATVITDSEKDFQKKTKGRVKIKMEFIPNKLRRYTTFSKRKTGIMKKAYELSTLTGTQVMLLVASETGHVYTFATKKLQPMITSDSGKSLIQKCLNKNESDLAENVESISKIDSHDAKAKENLPDNDSLSPVYPPPAHSGQIAKGLKLPISPPPAHIPFSIQSPTANNNKQTWPKPSSDINSRRIVLENSMIKNNVNPENSLHKDGETILIPTSVNNMKITNDTYVINVPSSIGQNINANRVAINFPTLCLEKNSK